MLSSKPQDNYIMLYGRVTMDTPSLDTIMGAKAGMGESDESTGTLWRGWKNSWEHGVVQVRLRPLLTSMGHRVLTARYGPRRICHPRVSYVPVSRWTINELIFIQCSHPVCCAAQRV
jgi:hypothetical protein